MLKCRLYEDIGLNRAERSNLSTKVERTPLPWAPFCVPPIASTDLWVLSWGFYNDIKNYFPASSRCFQNSLLIHPTWDLLYFFIHNSTAFVYFFLNMFGGVDRL